MKLFIALVVTCVSFTAWSGRVDRMPSFYVQMFAPDSTIKEGKSQVKISLSTQVGEAYYKLRNEKDWTKIKNNRNKKTIHLLLESNAYEFRFVKKGYVETSGTLKLKSQNYYDVKVNMFKPRIDKYNYPIQSRKPAIYLYSENPIDLELKVEPKGSFSYTYPEYKHSWKVHVDQNVLTVNGQTYDYLFWEGLHQSIDYNKNEGFVVAGTETTTFLDEKLDFMGFNAKEKQDFICYWGPILQKNKFNKIHFLTGEAYNKQIAGYESSEKIDSELRLLMLFESTDQPETMEEQVLPQIKRSGVTLIEWGGAEVSDLKFN